MTSCLLNKLTKVSIRKLWPIRNVSISLKIKYFLSMSQITINKSFSSSPNKSINSNKKIIYLLNKTLDWKKNSSKKLKKICSTNKSVKSYKNYDQIPYKIYSNSKRKIIKLHHHLHQKYQWKAVKKNQNKKNGQVMVDKHYNKKDKNRRKKKEKRKIFLLI